MQHLKDWLSFKCHQLCSVLCSVGIISLPKQNSIPLRFQPLRIITKKDLSLLLIDHRHNSELGAYCIVNIYIYIYKSES